MLLRGARESTWGTIVTKALVLRHCKISSIGDRNVCLCYLVEEKDADIHVGLPYNAYAHILISGGFISAGLTGTVNNGVNMHLRH